METKSQLDSKTLDHLRDLVRINIDSAQGFDRASEVVESKAMQLMFRHYAAERTQFATELRQLVQMNDEEAEDCGSISAQIHRWWISIRGTVQDGQVKAMLAEAERGEDSIKRTYEEALRSSPGSAVSDVLHKQYRAIKTAHDRIRDLRDETD